MDSDVTMDVDIPAVIDETGMCVVNIKSITQRISSMTTEEFNYVSDISSQFLTHFIRLAHCPDANEVKDAAFSMFKLLLNSIFDNDSMKNKFVSYKSTQDLATESSSSKNVGEAIMSVIGPLDPIAILTNILNDGSSEGGGGNDTLSKSIFSVLEGYNPLKLDDLIMLEKCGEEGQGCSACSQLQRTLITSPNEALLYLLRCLNHRRFNFGGNIESARASSTFIKNENNPCVIIVPLRNLLLNCVDATGTLSKISASNGEGTDVLYSDSNEMWVSSLYESVKRLQVHERAYLSQIYAFLIFSRHRQQTGDCIKQFLYTIFARFLYSATEILFCANENASEEVDKGKFLAYIKGWINTSAMSCTLNTMKAYQSWRNEGSSVAPVLNLFSGKWKKHYINSETLAKVGLDIADFICSMANPIKGRSDDITTSGLDSVRSVRQADKYIPYGFVKQHRGSLRILPTGISAHAKQYSNGNNIPCNCFHVLSRIKGGEILGPTTQAVDQATFIKAITPGVVENGTGKIMGLITAYIDKTILGSVLPANDKECKERENKFMEDIIFSKMMIHEESMNHCKTVPPKRMLTNPITTMQRSIAKCFDTRIYALLLLWQRPCVEYSNVSALTASQLELMLSKDPKWAEFITRIFFIMERVNFQLVDAIFKNDGLGVLFSPTNTDAIQKLMDSSINIVFKDWAAATSSSSSTENTTNTVGAKAQYSSELYDILHKIVIEKDMDPACVIQYSHFLCGYVKYLDELLLKML
uniref:Wsv332-like protein n=1 Tax=Sesarmops intermedium nimavirus TaxID=2133796 RepID=A0A401IPN3_9VIRU|nr:MAG: wsv332-like protein [Sesarmops intermedium nimavirus]GBG35567.1 wsv332-like protein [Sesarmops intermedium nimavirus]